MSVIKNVALFGASGAIGEPILNALCNSGKFNVTIIKREGSSSTYSQPVKVVTADYTSVESVTSALVGQDAVVSAVGYKGLAGQTVFVDAAVAAGVKRFLPSDFGSNLSSPTTAALPLSAPKIAIHKQLETAAASNPDFTYTYVTNNAFLDWGMQMSFLLNWKDTRPKLYDGGNGIFTATTLASVAEAVVGVLSHPDETKNRFVFIKDVDLTQNQLLEIVKRVDPQRNFEEPIHISTADLLKSADESEAKGNHVDAVYGYLFRLTFGPPEYGSHLEEVDNQLLGLKGKTEADIEEIIRAAMATSA